MSLPVKRPVRWGLACAVKLCLGFCLLLSLCRANPTHSLIRSAAPAALEAQAPAYHDDSRDLHS